MATATVIMESSGALGVPRGALAAPAAEHAPHDGAAFGVCLSERVVTYPFMTCGSVSVVNRGTQEGRGITGAGLVTGRPQRPLVDRAPS